MSIANNLESDIGTRLNMTYIVKYTYYKKQKIIAVSRRELPSKLVEQVHENFESKKQKLI